MVYTDAHVYLEMSNNISSFQRKDKYSKNGIDFCHSGPSEERQLRKFNN